MGFFPSNPSIEGAPHPRRPLWAGPPDNALPGVIPLQLLLAQTEELAISVGHLGAYPDGLELTVFVASRAADLDVGPWELFHWKAPEPLRFGVQFADGAKATTLDAPVSDDPPRAAVTAREGGGGGRRWWQVFWIWPLPPTGPLTFAVEWPARGLPLTRREIAAEPIRAAARHAVKLWPPA